MLGRHFKVGALPCHCQAVKMPPFILRSMLGKQLEVGGWLFNVDVDLAV